MGGISMAVSAFSLVHWTFTKICQNHPVTGTPAYFIHPCNTAEALRETIGGRSVSPLEYLQLWFGLVASLVGLYLPKELVVEPVSRR